MRVVTYSSFRENLKSELRRCREDAEPILVANRDEAANAVVLNVRDYEALMETIRIYENPALHEKILRGLRQVVEGTATERELFDA